MKYNYIPLAQLVDPETSGLLSKLFNNKNALIKEKQKCIHSSIGRAGAS